MRPMYLQLKQLLLPPASPLLLAFVGLALLAAGRRSGRWLTGIGLLLAWLLSCEGFCRPAGAVVRQGARSSRHAERNPGLGRSQ
jgi:hypothetical protein